MIRDEFVFLVTFIPRRLLHRNRQLETLASCLRPAVKGRRPRNAFLYGPPGTSKTAMYLYVFERPELKGIFVVNHYRRSEPRKEEVERVESKQS